MSIATSTPSANVTAYTYTLTAAKDVPLTMFALAIEATDNQTGATVTLTSDKGADSETIPIKSGETVPKVSKAVFHFTGGDVALDIDPPTPIAYRSTGFRLVLASGTFKAGTTTTTLTYTLNQPAVPADK
jgi:hypothetical protein